MAYWVAISLLETLYGVTLQHNQQPQVGKTHKGNNSLWLLKGTDTEVNREILEGGGALIKESEGLWCFSQWRQDTQTLITLYQDTYFQIRTLFAQRVAQRFLSITEQNHLPWDILDRAENLFKHMAAWWNMVVNHDNSINIQTFLEYRETRVSPFKATACMSEAIELAQKRRKEWNPSTWGQYSLSVYLVFKSCEWQEPSSNNNSV